MITRQLIDTIAFFAHFSPEEKAMLADSDSHFARYQNGEYLIREGDKDQSLFILVEGKVVVTREGHPTNALATLEPGAVFGEMSFLTGRPRFSHVLALGRVTVFRLDGGLYTRFTPEMKLKVQDRLIALLVDRLDRMNETLTQTLGELFALQ